MKAFSNSGIENLSDTSYFYPAQTNLYHTNRYVNLEQKLRRSIYNSDVDMYSDLSEDSSSALSFDSSEYTKHNYQGNQNCLVHPEMRSFEEAWVRYGNICDSNTIPSLEMTNSSNSTRFSDAEMGELILLEEQQRLQYLAELVHVEADIEAADYFAKCYSEAPPKAHWDDGPILQNPDDFLTQSTQMSGVFKKENYMKNERRHQREKSSECFRNCRPRMANSKFLTLKSKRRKPKGVYPHPCKSQHLPLGAWSQKEVPEGKFAKCPTKASDVKKISSNALLNSRKQKNAKAKAKAVPFPCDLKSSSDADQKVFLGGLPIGMTERTLREQMSALGYKVLKRPKVLRGFAPEVLLRSVEQAQELVAKRTIILDGVKVEVRPWKSSTRHSQLKNIPSVGNRSIFLQGLRVGTTAKDIKDTLKKMGMRVVNQPVIKDGFSGQVILETDSQAQDLIRMKKMFLNVKFVDVRPFVN